MKQRLLLTFLLISASCSLTFSQGIKPPPPDKAAVYFVRMSSFGFIVDFTYFDSNKVIGRFNGKNYMRLEMEPGEHLFWAFSDNKDFITADLAPGKIYLIDADPEMGTFQAAVRLLPVDPSDSKKIQKMEKIINERTSQNMPQADCERSTKNLEKTITKALEKYHADVAKGKKFKRVEKTMNYQK